MNYLNISLLFTSVIFCFASDSVKKTSFSTDNKSKHAWQSSAKYETCACRKPSESNFGKQIGVQLSADLKLSEQSTKLKINLLIEWSENKYQLVWRQFAFKIFL